MSTETRESDPPKAAALSPLPGDHQSAAEPSGYKGDNPSTAGPGSTAVNSETPEGKTGQINPSPESTNITPDLPADGGAEEIR